MNNYIFFIGGSGARAYTAFIHCAAAGVLETKTVSTLMIDPDVGNKANLISKKLYRQYNNIFRSFIDEDDRGIFTCKITMETEEVLSPVGSHAVTLKDAIGESNSDRKRLLECFYTEVERGQDLQHGFYAHPNIGCVFFSDFQDTEFDNCLDKIENQLDNNEDVRVALVGSIFGGTGAAGIPTIFKLLRDRFKRNSNYNKLCIGGIFFEPYFRVIGVNQNRNNISINTEEFYYNTYEALSYYQAIENGSFNNIYLVGQQSLDIVSTHYADGGAEQDNKPHVIELFAALALDHFFTKTDQNGVFGAVRKEILGWDDFPESAESKSPRMLKMADFARAQAIFIAEICGYINSERSIFKNKCKDIGIMIPKWYKRYILNDNKAKEKITEIEKYSVSFMDWLYKINCKYDEEGNLFPDSNIKLFGSALQDIYELLPMEGEQNSGNLNMESQKRKNSLKKFRDNFNIFVDTASNVEYILDKTLLVLSMASNFSGKVTALGAVQLFLKIVSLAGERKS